MKEFICPQTQLLCTTGGICEEATSNLRYNNLQRRIDAVETQDREIPLDPESFELLASWRVPLPTDLTKLIEEGDKAEERGHQIAQGHLPIPPGSEIPGMPHDLYVKRGPEGKPIVCLQGTVAQAKAIIAGDDVTTVIDLLILRKATKNMGYTHAFSKPTSQ